MGNFLVLSPDERILAIAVWGEEQKIKRIDRVRGNGPRTRVSSTPQAESEPRGSCPGHGDCRLPGQLAVRSIPWWRLREDDLAAEAIGVNTAKTRLIAFTVAGALAGLAGVFYAHNNLFVSYQTFTTDESFILLAMLVIGGLGSLPGPMLGVVVLLALPEALRGAAIYRYFLYGLVLLVVAPRWTGRAGEHPLAEKERRDGEEINRCPKRKADGMSEMLLEVESVSKSFGGLKALQEVSFQVGSGEVMALIGPNGAGKSTLLNIINGFLRPSAGRIRLNGKDVTQAPVHRIALHGVGRTFQKIRVFKGLSVLDNVRMAVRNPVGVADLLFRSRKFVRLEKESLERAHQLVELVGLADRAGDLAVDLPYGQQRLVEIARALAGSRKSAPVGRTRRGHE